MCLPINHHPTIRMQRLPGDQTTILTRQKDEARRNLARLAWSSHRGPAELIQSILLHRRRDQRRPHRSGSDGVDADAEFDLLVREAAGEGDDGAFGGGVVEEVGAADVGVHGGAVDDRVAGFEVLEGVFGDVEVGVDVGVEGFEPLFPVGCQSATCGCFGGFMEEDGVQRGRCRRGCWW